MALRPEGTAPIVRAFVQHHPVPPWKAWYVAPSFRHENPQHGRYRQHSQLGVEALGVSDADIDVEVVSLAHDFFAGLGLRRVTLKLHSMGDAVCRPGYLALLRAFLAERADLLCAAHRERHLENPLRVLDCKAPECLAATEDAPHFLDHLCDSCRAHFARVRAGLDSLGVSYEIDHRLVRGFDYYTRTTFEFAADALDAAQNGIGGGGRYDGLVELLGGDATPGIGFGIGIERVLLACDAEGVFATAAVTAAHPLHAYVIDTAGGEAAVSLTAELRRAGLRADRAFDGRSMKSQIKSADRSGALVALVVGPKEQADGTVGLRPLRTATKEQRTVPQAAVVDELRAYLAGPGETGGSGEKRGTGS
jgi:histidyl-tRNA synthetase